MKLLLLSLMGSFVHAIPRLSESDDIPGKGTVDRLQAPFFRVQSTSEVEDSQQGEVVHLGDYSGETLVETTTKRMKKRRRRKRTRSISDPKDWAQMKAPQTLDGNIPAVTVESGSQEIHSRALSSKLRGSNTRFLKNKLLDNLNRYFGNGVEELEILSPDSTSRQPEGSWNSQTTVSPVLSGWTGDTWGTQQPPRAQPLAENPWLTAWTTPSPFVFGFHESGFQGNPFENPPTVQPQQPQPMRQQMSPTEFPQPPQPWETTNRITRQPAGRPSAITVDVPSLRTRKKKRGESLNKETITTIRSWRNRLYKAFKRNEAPSSRVIRVFNNQTSGGQVVDIPEVHERIEHSIDPVTRRVRNYGGDQNFGPERSGYTYEHGHIPQVRRPSVVYIPAPTFTPATAPPYTEPSFPTLSSYQTQNQQPNYFPTYQVTATAPPMTPPPTLPPLITQPPPNGFQPEETDYSDGNTGDVDGMQMRGVRCTPGEESCSEQTPQTSIPLTDINEDKCNSARLKQIILMHIVPQDAEASKRAVQAMAEEAFGKYFDAVCGTGFFSYIAHTDEFCQASSGGVNCYVFSPVCGGEAPFKKVRRRKSINLVNRN